MPQTPLQQPVLLVPGPYMAIIQWLLLRTVAQASYRLCDSPAGMGCCQKRYLRRPQPRHVVEELFVGSTRQAREAPVEVASMGDGAALGHSAGNERARPVP